MCMCRQDSNGGIWKLDLSFSNIVSSLLSGWPQYCSLVCVCVCVCKCVFDLSVFRGARAQTQQPECLFSFHAGVIQGMDVSTTSHLMATTTLDRESASRHFALSGI